MGLASMVFETKVRKHKNKGKTVSRRRLPASNHKINAKFTDNPSDSDNVSIEVTIDNETYNLNYELKN